MSILNVTVSHFKDRMDQRNKKLKSKSHLLTDYLIIYKSQVKRENMMIKKRISGKSEME